MITQEGLILEAGSQRGQVLLVEGEVIAIVTVDEHAGVEIDGGKFAALDLFQHHGTIRFGVVLCQAGFG